MKIVIDARMLYASGIGRYIYHLLENLQELDTTNHYVVIMQPADRERWQPTKPNFSVIELAAPIYTVAEQLRLYRLLRRLKPDLVHFPAPNLPILYRRRHVTTILDLTLLNYRHPRGKSWRYALNFQVFKLVFGVAVRHSARLLTMTETVAAEVRQRYKIAHPITVTPGAAETLAAKPQAYPPVDGHRFLLYVGNAYPYKNLRRLIDAFAALDDPSLRLVLVGKGDYFFEQLQAYVREAHISGVIFTGFVSDAELAWLYRHAALYVFPSLSEGFGLPGLEAMQYGLPVAAAKASCLPEVYGDAAAYFDPNNAAEMTHVIAKTLADPKRLAALQTAGLARVKRFSWKRMAEQTLAVYQEVLKNR